MWRGGRRRPATAGNGMLYVLAIHFLTQFAQQERKPPVTALLILINSLFFLRPGKLDNILPSIDEVCLNPHLILKDLDVKRIFLSAFYHVDETHLVYNMLSLLWKGVQLEGTMGSKKFAWMIFVLLGMSHSLVVLAAKALAMFADYPDALFSHCAVGFSAVLFALKVILNWNSPTYTDVYGVLVPSRHAAWAELLLVQMFVPGTSFLGHLSGIIAGLLYIHVPRYFSDSGATSRTIRRLALFPTFLLWPIRILVRPFLWWRRRTFGRGIVGSQRNNTPDSSASFGQAAAGVWRCPVCTYDNMMYQNECEMCGMPQFRPSAPPWPSSSEPSAPLSMEEMRRARLARFSR